MRITMFDPLMFVAATQIIIESLPISSSGHMMLVNMWLHRLGFHVSLDIPDYLDYFLHGPTILVVMIYFFRSWWSLLRFFLHTVHRFHTCHYSWHAMPDSNKCFVKILGKIICFVVVGNIVTVAWYAIGHGALKQVSTISDLPILIAGFTITSCLLLSLKALQGRINRVNRSLSLVIALILGCVQGLAGQLPGISRYGSTFVVARLCGISSRRALQFSFLLFSPLLFGAFLLSGLPAFFMQSSMHVLLSIPWFITLVLSTLIAYLCFVVAAYMAERNYLWLFGIYMMIPIVAAVILLLI